jgi:hypothetical protein
MAQLDAQAAGRSLAIAIAVSVETDIGNAFSRLTELSDCKKISVAL